jgi:HlyD family secretion protein
VKRPVKRTLQIVVALAIAGLLFWMMIPTPVEVEAAPVRRGPLQVTVDEEAKTRIRHPYVIAAPVEGQLQRVVLEPGDQVVAGRTVLAVITPKDPALLDPRTHAELRARVDAASARLEQSLAAVDLARTEFELAQAEYQRLRELPPGNVSTKELDDAMRTSAVRAQGLRSARIGHDIARYELEMARIALGRTFGSPGNDATEHVPGPASGPATRLAERQIELVCPIDGRVLRRMLQSATPVLAGAEILEVGDPRDLEIELEVLTTEAVNVRPDQRVQFVRWGGDGAIHGIVRLVEPQAFTKISALGVEEQRVRIICDFADPPDTYSALGDAFRLDGRIIVWEQPDALVVPTSALFRRQQLWQVFVVAEGRASVRDVTLGRMNGDEAQVLDGLREGEQVIVHPSDQVAPGTRVKVRESDV